MLHYRKNDKQKSLNLCNEILNTKISSEKVRVKLKSRRARVIKLKHKILNDE